MYKEGTNTLHSKSAVHMQDSGNAEFRSLPYSDSIYSQDNSYYSGTSL